MVAICEAGETGKMTFTTILLLVLPLALAEITAPVDLTAHFDENTIYSTDNKPFVHTRVTEDDSKGMWIAGRDFAASEHGGTHMDAPIHFNKAGWRIGDIPFERFFGKAVVIDLAKEAKTNPDLAVDTKIFEDWEKVNGKIPDGAIVVLNFNWTSKSNNKTEFLGSPNPADNTTFHFPGLSVTGAQWLTTRTVYGVVTDTISIDPGQSKDFQAHQLLASKNMFIIEQAALNTTTKLPPKGYRILALPMKIRSGTGAPCRLLAMP